MMIRLALCFLSILMLTSLPAAATTDAPKTNKESVCDIKGTVEKLEYVQRSPWSDGTPSTMNTTELHIRIAITDRTPHDNKAAADDPCHEEKAAEVRTYKLCSPTRVRQGDLVSGTEGTQTGSSKVTGCLFDLVVHPKKS